MEEWVQSLATFFPHGSSRHVSELFGLVVSRQFLIRLNWKMKIITKDKGKSHIVGPQNLWYGNFCGHLNEYFNLTKDVEPNLVTSHVVFLWLNGEVTRIESLSASETRILAKCLKTRRRYQWSTGTSRGERCESLSLSTRKFYCKTDKFWVRRALPITTVELSCAYRRIK